MAPAHWTRKRYRAAKYDAVANKITVPNMFIGYGVLFSHASVFASSMQDPYDSLKYKCIKIINRS